MPQKRRGPVLCLLLGRQEEQRAEAADSGVVILDDRMTTYVKGFGCRPGGSGGVGSEAAVGKPPKNEPAGKRRRVCCLWGFGGAAGSAGDGVSGIAEIGRPPMIADWLPLPLSAARVGPVDGVVPALAGTRVKWTRGRERNVAANGCCQETRRIVIGSDLDPGADRWRAARCAAACKDLDNDHAVPPQQEHGGRWSVVASGAGVSCAAGGSTSGIGTAISCVARAMLALQPALASSP
jgi:hypothetical protein